MNYNGWEYIGDINLTHGGFFWRQEDPSTKDISVVQIIPYKDAGGPDNLFRIKVGQIFLDSINKEELDAARNQHIPAKGPLTIDDDVLATMIHWGLEDADEDWTLMIGPKDNLWGGIGVFPEPDRVLRDGTSLRKWIEREYLHPVRREPSPTIKM